MSAFVLTDAHQQGFSVDERNLGRQIERVAELSGGLDGLRVDTIGYGLWVLDTARHAPNDMTREMTASLLNCQKELGYWKTTVNRPPAEASNFTTNYLAIRGLNRYGTTEQQDEIATRTRAVREWMASETAADTEDEVFRLRLAGELGLAVIERDVFVAELLRKQHAGGGWAQRPHQQPDAYATGLVLVALCESGGLSCDHSAWQRGLKFLLQTQEPDGSWHVVTRAQPIQEYFESGFPHGKDQFISAFATGWATKALLMSLRPASQ
jgi:N-acyl-D-amino-acid deacylase